MSVYSFKLIAGFMASLSTFLFLSSLLKPGI